MYLITDRGTADRIVYFGWVIATNCNIIITANGQVTGYFGLMELLRTESRLNLALVTFLHHFSKYHDITLNTTAWTHYCDNMTTLRRMQNHKQGYNHHPAVTTKPDFDKQFQIEHMLK
eukprot:10444520-Ditylum_brightwellii.AAC.1